MKRKVPLEEALKKKLPPRAVPLALWHLRQGRVQLKIAKPRLTKLGDFMPARASGPNKISVNGDLNPFQFLWTLVHELAHLHVWEEHGRSVDPHGREWQIKFLELMVPYLDGGIFPPILECKLREHLTSAAASTCSDPVLYKLFSKFDLEVKHFVDDILPGAEFVLKGGRRFRKGKKLRTRYECLDMENGKVYLVHGHAEIELAALGV